jgi:signal transduction histidine kinase
LDISRIESGKGIFLQKEPCLMGEIIRQVVSHFGAESKNHSFFVDVKDESNGLLADKEKVEQILTNLIANAVKYSTEGGEIRVTARPLTDQYQVVVEDQGVGMTEEQVERVFEKFYRADTSNTAADGTGLGMSIVKNNVEAHGGKVNVESKFGVGTKVTFTLPFSPDQK